MNPLKLIIILLFFSATSSYAQSVPQVLSRQNLKDAYYRFPYRTAQKRCQNCPEPKYGFDLTADTLLAYISQDTVLINLKNKVNSSASLTNPKFPGDVEMSTIGKGVIIRSPNGTRFRLTISDKGDIIATSIINN